ncbi:hypothetical protein [uncultured Rhodoblastus sp.]|uniref:hypothetical protein n=1 Tax=uncultured Rhodoblastus sp. TaxID=543037 RepID=UPI0025CF78AB|nr:hypothetical protein [uncultured Rhodoblastus sp.]
MSQPEFLSDKALKLICSAERETSNDNEADNAARFVFRQIRKDGVLLSDILMHNAENQDEDFQPDSELLIEKIRLSTELFKLKATQAKSDGKILSLGLKLTVAQNDNADLRESSKKAKAKFSERIEAVSKASDAKIAAMKAKMKSVRVNAAAELAAERAKPAPVSANVVAALARMVSSQEAEIKKLEEALAKAAVSPAVAAAPTTPASAPAAAVSKRSQGALQAWVTRRKNAAAAAPAAAPIAPAPAPAVPKARREPRTGSLRADVLELLLAMPGHKFTGNNLANYRLWLFPNNCAAKAVFHTDEWNSLSGQVRTEIHWLRDDLIADGVVALSKPYGTRRTWTYSVPGSVRTMSCHVHVGRDFYKQFRWLRDDSGFAPGSWRIDFDKVLGPVVRFENENDGMMFKLAVG